MTPLVSIIIPVYKVEKFIERCARSIFEQTYDNLEIVFVNDCTPDNSIEIIYNVLNEYPNRKEQIRIINFKNNQGVATVRKEGLKCITGKYCIQFDSDDSVESTMITEMVRIAEQENADITICDFMYIYPNKSKHIHINPSLNPQILLQQVLTGKVHSSLCNKLIKRTLYLKNDITFIEGLNMREDLSVMFRLLYFTEKIAYIPKPFYHYFKCNENSYTATKMNELQQKNAIQISQFIDDFNNTHEITTRIKQAFEYFHVAILTSILLYGTINNSDFKQPHFLKISFKSILTHPTLPFYYKLVGILHKFHCNYLIELIRLISKRS